ncbi:Hypp4161 [Branchiostoma lanceolatum]|uniref:Hypp4161 protein n=1 Tax=Branchiostoma lanceolatum TaxID=7740 RepID=A0A8K0AAQ3_BRALA|nr:Hypp4161 [Branchiostoma lanceolatum]
MKSTRSGELPRRLPTGRKNPTVYASEEYPEKVEESESQDSFAVDISDLSMDESTRGSGEAAWSEKTSDESDEASWVYKLSNAPPLMKQPIKLAVRSVEPIDVNARSRQEVRGGKNARETAYRFPERSTNSTVVSEDAIDHRGVEQKAVPKTSGLDTENLLSRKERGYEDGACNYETDTEGAVERLSNWYERLSNVPPLMDETLASSHKEGNALASSTGATSSHSSAAEAPLPDATAEQWRWVQATVLEPDGPLHEPVVSSLAHVVSTESLSRDSRKDGTLTPGDVLLTTMEDLRDMICGLLDRLLNFLRDRVTLNCKDEAPTEVEKKLSLDVVCFLNAMSSLDLTITGENKDLYLDAGDDSYRERPLYIPEHTETKPRTDMNILERLMTKLHPKTVQEQYAETYAEGNHSGHHKKRSVLSEYAVWLKSRENTSYDRDVNQNAHGGKAPKSKFPSLAYFVDKIRGRAKEADDIEMGTVDLNSDGDRETLLTEKLMRRALEEERRLKGLLRRLMVEMKEDVRVDPRRTSSDLSAWSTSSVILLNSEINTLAAKMVDEVCEVLTNSDRTASRGSVTPSETCADRKAFTEDVMKVVVTLATKKAKAKNEARGADKSSAEDSPHSTPDISTDDVADLAVGLWYGDVESDVDSLIGDLRSLRESLVAGGVESTVIDGKQTRTVGAQKTEV